MTLYAKSFVVRQTFIDSLIIVMSYLSFWMVARKFHQVSFPTTSIFHNISSFALTHLYFCGMNPIFIEDDVLPLLLMIYLL